MNEKICYCFGAGSYFGNEQICTENRFIIAVDGGLKELEKRKLKADLIIGDFDSLGQTPSAENAIKLPCIKDDTDMMAALKEGLKRGLKKYIIFGGTGGRISHTLANIDALFFLKNHGATGFICGEKEDITLACKVFCFDSKFKGFISVFPRGNTAIISEKGLKYKLNEEKISSDFPLGVSNEFLGENGEITVHSGEIILAIERQKNVSLTDFQIE